MEDELKMFVQENHDMLVAKIKYFDKMLTGLHANMVLSACTLMVEKTLLGGNDQGIGIIHAIFIQSPSLSHYGRRHFFDQPIQYIHILQEKSGLLWSPQDQING